MVEGGSPTKLLHEVASGRRTAWQVILLYDPLLTSFVRRYLGARRFAGEGEDLIQTIRLALVVGHNEGAAGRS